jgi:hypothetical protein
MMTGVFRRRRRRRRAFVARANNGTLQSQGGNRPRGAGTAPPAPPAPPAPLSYPSRGGGESDDNRHRPLAAAAAAAFTHPSLGAVWDTNAEAPANVADTRRTTFMF